MTIKNQLMFVVLSLLLNLLSILPSAQAELQEVQQLHEILEQSDENIRYEPIIPILRKALDIRDEETLQVDGAKFFDQHPPNGKQIVLSLNAGGSGCPCQLACLAEVGNEIKLFFFDTHWGGIARSCLDINEDGKMEIIAYETLAMNLSHAECVEWPTVHSWTGTSYVEATLEPSFAPFYANYLNKLENRLRNFDQEKTIYPPSMQEACRSDIETGIFLAKHVLGDKRAGLEEAKRWAKSTNVGLRRNAVTVLVDIEGDEAIATLNELAKDTDVIIKEKVNLRLDNLQKR